MNPEHVNGGAPAVNPLQSLLDTHGVVILDGGFATELEARGCDLNDPLWSAKLLIEDPSLIAGVHRDYLQAGADCIITASYQATVAGFVAKGKTVAEAERLLVFSIELARRARDSFWTESDGVGKSGRPQPLVAASVGPYGAYLANGSEYHGSYGLDEDELYLFHRQRMALLIDGKPDLLACETIPCFAEAKAVVRCLGEHPGMTGWLSFCCRDGLRLRNGERIVDCAHWLDAVPQVAAIGVNCTEPQYISSLISEIRRATLKPIVVYPNSGEIYDIDCRCWSGRDTLAPFVDFAQEWYQAGARVIGGCCRTSPQDIRAIADCMRGTETISQALLFSPGKK